MSVNRLKRRIGIISGIWSALAAVDAVQADADKCEEELTNARDAEKRAADRATQAARVHGLAVRAAVQAEAKLASLNPFAEVVERS